MIQLTNYEVGVLGEQLVTKYFKSLGSQVEQSKNKYDESKDLIIDGIHTEVKTQSLYRAFPFPDGPTNAFTVPILSDTKIHRNQLSKCLNVPRLIFVRKASTQDPVIRLYEAPPVGKRLFSITQNTKDMRYTAGFKLGIMKELCWVTDRKMIEKLMDNWRGY